ncbi:MAG: cell division protein FtsZ [Bacteroidota bacterium]|nr:cell division protein FtsZ [Bacteroidota bacterium]MDP4233963.1 cell division protein FtsZ [Bacteroidota bacterium]MDP4242786.1 cell division protein FtsZ [Bacteroidota bacterium]MDP4288500.1 cell division protein FtsZ [Bacteroidota bacterium]
MIELDTKQEYGAKIRVVGVGGGGSNAVNAMINKGLEGVEFCVLNTDVQALEKSTAPIKLQIGKNLTRGLGAGADPEVGRKAVEEDREEIMHMMAGSDMIFVTAGMGGGTGTGGVPVVASIAKSIGALVVGIVTKPFAFEGKRRSRQAEDGIEELRRNVDTLIVIPNQKLLALVENSTSFLDGFSLANQVLYNATRGISELIIRHGYINVDFADVRTVMREMGDAIMGSGVGRGEHRASVAAEHAISSPLLEGVSIQGAQGVLVNITGGRSMSLLEVSEATQIIHDAAGDDANIIFGAVLDESMEEEIMVTVIATGFNSRPKYNGLSVGGGGELRPARASEHAEEIVPRLRTQRIVQATPEETVAIARPAIRETTMADQQSVPLPRVERMFVPRGTLREKDRSPSFDGGAVEVSEHPTASSVSRLTPRSDTRHVPSGPRDLKDFDQPAYLRRGVQLPPIGEAEEPQAVAQETPKPEEHRSRDHDDKPAFLKRIMD